MKDYKISELIYPCQTHRECKSCPAIELCDIIEENPLHWKLNLEDSTDNKNSMGNPTMEFKDKYRSVQLNRNVLHELLYEQAASYFDMFGYHIFPDTITDEDRCFTAVKHIDKRQLVAFSIYIGTSPVSGKESLIVEGKLDSYVCYTGMILVDPEDYKGDLESVYLIMMKKLNDLLHSDNFDSIKNTQLVLPDKVEESF